MNSRNASTAAPADAAALAAETDGLAIVRGMLAGEVAHAPIADALDYRLVAADFGSAVFEGVPAARFGNPHGTVHGGWIATLLDSATGCAVRTTLRRGTAYTTLDLKVTFLRALKAGAGVVRAEARTVHSGGRVAAAEGRLVGADGTVYAVASATCLVLPARAAAASSTPNPEAPHDP